MAAQWRTVKVFVSSTFIDMQSERDYLVRFVFPELREELVKRRVHLLDIDLRWGVASDQVIKVCREIIDECEPRFVCMLGGRYGSTDKDETGRSVTADEIYHALHDFVERKASIFARLRRKLFGWVVNWQADRNHFFYFRSFRVTGKMPADFRENRGTAKWRKLRELKRDIVLVGFNPRFYRGFWDGQRLVRLEKFGRQVRHDLLQSIDAELGREIPATPDKWTDERNQMHAFVAGRLQWFLEGSRQDQLNELFAFASSRQLPSIIVLSGEPGSGKSALLSRFCHVMQDSDVSVVTHFVGASADSTDLRHMLRRILYEVERPARDNEIPNDVTDLIARLPLSLERAAQETPVLLIIDAVNQLDPTDDAHQFHWLPRELPDKVRIVVSSVDDDNDDNKTLGSLRDRVDQVREMSLGPLNDKDVEQIALNFLSRFGKHLEEEQLGLLLAKPQVRNPLYLLTALEELRTLGDHQEIQQRIADLPGDPKSLFRWMLTDRLSHDHGFRDDGNRPVGQELVRKFVSYLETSRRGLSFGELSELIEPEQRHGNVAALERLLRPYLMRRGELLDFYHAQLSEAVHEEYLGDPKRQQAAHEQLAEFFAKQRFESNRACSELVYHQILGRMWNELTITFAAMPLTDAGQQQRLASGAFDAIAQRLHLAQADQEAEPASRAITLLSETGSMVCADLTADLLERAFLLSGWVLDHCAAAMDICVDRCSPLKKVQALLRLNNSITSGRPGERRRPYLEEAEEASRKAEAHELRPYVLTQMAFQLVPSECLALCREACDLAEATGDPLMCWEAFFNKARALKHNWQFDDASKYFSKAHGLFTPQQRPARVIWSLEKWATTETRVGNFAAAARLLHEEHEILRYQHQSSLHSKHRELIATLLVHLGDTKRGCAMLKQSYLDLKQHNRKEYVRALCKLIHASIDTILPEEQEEYANELEHAIDTNVPDVSWFMTVWAMQTLARLRGRMNQLDAASPWLELAEGIVEEKGIRQYHIATWQIRAEWALADRRLDEARDLAASALTLARNSGENLQWPDIAQLLSSIHIQRGDQNSARNWEQLAAEAFQNRERGKPLDTLQRILDSPLS